MIRFAPAWLTPCACCHGSFLAARDVFRREREGVSDCECHTHMFRRCPAARGLPHLPAAVNDAYYGSKEGFMERSFTDCFHDWITHRHLLQIDQSMSSFVMPCRTRLIIPLASRLFQIPEVIRGPWFVYSSETLEVQW